MAEDQMLLSGRQVTAPWRYEKLAGAGHWLPLEAPQQVAELACEWFAAY
jgi:pimeloyl-ACP methyl ester carboxylesterase